MFADGLAFRYCDDRNEWDSLVRVSPTGSVFAESNFLDVLGLEPRLAVVYDRAEMVLGAVVMPELDPSLSLLPQNGQRLSPPYPFYLSQGIVLGDRLSRLPAHRRTHHTLEAIAFLLQELERRFDQMNFCLHPALRDIRSFSWFHYHEPQLGQFDVEVRYTGILDLFAYDGVEDHVRAVRRARRREWRRALSKGLWVHTSDDVECFAHLYVRTFGRQGITLDDGVVARTKVIVEAALRRGVARLWTCSTASGEPASMLLVLHDHRRAYCLFSAHEPRFRNTGASTLLMLDALWRCRNELGVRMVDLVGMNSPTWGDYKASLNAEPVPYYRLSWKR